MVCDSFLNLLTAFSFLSLLRLQLDKQEIAMSGLSAKPIRDRQSQSLITTSKGRKFLHRTTSARRIECTARRSDRLPGKQDIPKTPSRRPCAGSTAATPFASAKPIRCWAPIWQPLTHGWKPTSNGPKSSNIPPRGSMIGSALSIAFPAASERCVTTCAMPGGAWALIPIRSLSPWTPTGPGGRGGLGYGSRHHSQ